MKDEYGYIIENIIDELLKEKSFVIIDDIIDDISISLNKEKKFIYDALKEIDSKYTSNNNVVGIIDSKEIRRVSLCQAFLKVSEKIKKRLNLKIDLSDENVDDIIDCIKYELYKM